MKKAFALLLAAFFVFAAASCGSDNTAAEDIDALRKAVADLEERVDELEEQLQQATAAPDASSPAPDSGEEAPAFDLSAIIGSWSADVDGTGFMQFNFAADGTVAYLLGAYESEYSYYTGTYTVEGNVLTLALSYEAFGETSTMNTTIQVEPADGQLRITWLSGDSPNGSYLAIGDFAMFDKGAFIEV